MGKKTTLLITTVVLGMAASAAMGKLVAYYPLDEGSGTKIVDASGNGHDGTVENGAATWINGQTGFGKAIFFDGTNPAVGFVNCGTWNPSAGTGKLSVTFWVQYNGTNANYQGVIAKRDGWDPETPSPMMWYIECNQSSGAMGLARRGSYPPGAGTPPTGKWTHIAFTFDGTTVRSYMNGTEVGNGAFSFGPLTTATIYIGCDNGGGYNGFNGAIDDVRLYDNALTADEVKAAMQPGAGPKLAAATYPTDGATDVPRDAGLSWKPGQYAATHDVYFGTVKADVSAADRTSNLLVSQGQDANTFDPTVMLEYGKTYYWRIDEVNAAPDSSVFKGDVWSFTAEPYTYTVTGVTVAASSATASYPATKTIDGSGLTDGLHSSTDTDGWLSDRNAGLPAWIQYTFDRSYLIRQMHVWNSNQKLEAIYGFGAKSVLIECSPDGTTWNTLKTVEFAQADGSDTYAGFTVDMGDVLALSIRLTIQTNWSLYFKQAGLSEIRFSYVPVQARQPSPANNAEGVPVNSALDWREGRQAVSHKVYLGKDQAAVANGTALVDTTTESSYQPPSLDFGSFYYWKVDEVNSAASTPVWAGDVWTFTSAEYAAIDDFESYTNESPHRVFQTWIDGWGFSPDENFPDGGKGNDTGAMVGYDPSLGDIMETSIVHGGGQSMPVEYNNVNSPYYSEVERTWSSAQDWTTNGATELSLWFRGRPLVFVETPSSITMSGGGADIYNGTDQFRFAYKQLTGDGSITVRVDNVQTLASWTKSGVMMRESLDTLAVQAHVITAAAQSLVEWMYRTPTGNTTTTQFNTPANSTPLPVWLRLTRAGNVFTGEYSMNGTTWTKITATDGTATTSSTTINMPPTVYVGMVVCANASSGLAVADFSQVQVKAAGGSVTGQWETADIGVAQPGNSPDQVYLVLQDSAGKSKTIVHPDAQATCTNEWTQWRIALKDLAPVNAGAIKKMVIGFGDRSQPKASGSGRIFIDDIQYGRPILPIGPVAQ